MTSTARRIFATALLLSLLAGFPCDSYAEQLPIPGSNSALRQRQQLLDAEPLSELPQRGLLADVSGKHDPADPVPDASHQELLVQSQQQQEQQATPDQRASHDSAGDSRNSPNDDAAPDTKRNIKADSDANEAQAYLQRDVQLHDEQQRQQEAERAASGNGDDAARDLSSRSGRDRQRHLAARHDARYRLHQSSRTPPLLSDEVRRRALEDLRQEGLSGGGTNEALQRVLRRSDGFRKPAVQAAEDGAAGGIKPRASVGEVLVMTTIMAAVSGLGAVPFFFVGSLSAEWAAIANAIACGVMLAASFDLVHEGQPYSASLTVLGVILGALFIKASQEWLEKWEGVRFEGLQGINAQKTLLLVAVMAAHALGEGSGVGVSFCGNRGWAQGVLVTLAIGLHNIPEGLAVATVLVARGVAPKQALIWSVLTSMPQPAVAVPSFLFVNAFKALLPLALGFAAGCMVWMVFAELLPDALEGAAHSKIATAATFSAAWLEALRMALAQLERPDGSLASPFAADLSTALPAILALLPAALPAAAAGGLVSTFLAPGPVLQGIAAGLMAFSGTTSLFGASWGGQMSRFWTVGWAAAGAASVVAAWRWLSGVGGGHHPQQPAKLKAEMDGEGHTNGEVHTNGEAWVRPAAELISAISPLAESRHPWDSASSDLQLSAAEQNGGGGLPMYMKGPPADGEAAQPARRGASRGSVPLPPFGPQAVAAAVAAAVLVADGLPVGWQAASLAADSGAGAARLWLPLTLDALVRGLAGAALAAPLLGQTLRRCMFLAGAVGGTPVAAAALQVLRMAPDADSLAASGLASGGSAFKVQAATAGAVLMASLWLLMPAAHQVRGVSANKGFITGAVFAAVVSGVASVLCLSTPYCLSISSSD